MGLGLRTGALWAVDGDFIALRDRVASWVDSLSAGRLRSVIEIGQFLESHRERVDEYLDLWQWSVRIECAGKMEDWKLMTENCAKALEIDSQPLTVTVERFNANALEHQDPDFGKGSNGYNHFNGDPFHQPNPCLAPLATPPFYAVRVIPGDLGTFLGLRADKHARVLDDTQSPIKGLYAVGNDMASFMGGNYPGAGITIGPAMTFGYIAARHIAGIESND